jgi:hypothetical protein
MIGEEGNKERERGEANDLSLGQETGRDHLKQSSTA